MDPDEIKVVLKKLGSFLQERGKGELSYGESRVLYHCLLVPNCRYKDMAVAEHGFTANTLKNHGARLCQRLSEIFGLKEVKKSNLHELPDWLSEQQLPPDPPPPPLAPLLPPPSVPLLPPPPPIAWFRCTREDVDKICSEIQGRPSSSITGKRLICATGLSRRAQLDLRYALVEQLQHFDRVIVLNAENFQQLEHLRAYIARQVGYRVEGEPAAQALFEMLHRYRILLIIESTEVLFQLGARSGYFKADAKAYEVWLRRLLEFPPAESCLLWLGQEKPFCFDTPAIPLSCSEISGLSDDDAIALLQTEGVSIEQIDHWENIVSLCGGSPEWMLAQADWLDRRGVEDISAFSSRLVARRVTDALEEKLNRLAGDEYTLLVWLMLEPKSFKQLDNSPIPNLSPADKEEAITSLERRHLVKQDAQRCYHVTPPILEYVLATQVVDQIHTALAEGQVNALSRYPLVSGTAPASRQHWQIDHLLEPLAARQRNQHCDLASLMQSRLSATRQLPAAAQGYAAGNLISLAAALGVPLSGLEMRGLLTYHADLRQADLRQADFEGCRFAHLTLPFPCSGRLASSAAKDGTAIAAGDRAGHLLFWRQENGVFRLQAFRKVPQAIDKLLFQDRETLLFASTEGLYRWCVSGDRPPEKILDLPARASCLAIGSGYVAVGLIDGQIVLWETIRHGSITLSAHDNEVCSLAFSSDGHHLASLGFGNRALVWQLGAGIDIQSSCRSLMTGERICITAGWHGNTLLRAEAQNERLFIWAGESVRGEIPLSEPGGEIVSLCFSPSGEYLAGSTSRGLVFYASWRNGRALRSLQLTTSPEIVSANDNSSWLLGALNGKVQLYDLHRQSIRWEAQGACPVENGCNLNNARGLTVAEMDSMRLICLQV